MSLPPPPTQHWRRAIGRQLEFRPIADADLPFLSRLYASTRQDELVATAWSDAEKAAFLQMQFDAQHAHYQTHYQGSDWLVIVHGGAPIGRLYLARWAREHRIVDITFLPEHRGRGFGSALLHDLMDEAAAHGKALSIHVEKMNPAMRLYLRLGFRTAEDKGVYDLMRWEPA